MNIALYRKYRPRRFDEIVGQDAAAAALKNQVGSGRVGHSYIFTGIRGTGKTSFARILAKAVNCPHQSGGEPCGVCDICTGIDSGSILDVTEIDAASNSGVDNVRSLRDETAYYPAVCRMRVYIIDEVHMLTREAFNALLKIMEEPPAHVLFILATTEAHRVPATILSRCQRFDLRRIPAGLIKARLKDIAGREGIELAESGAEMISRLSDGALRDAFSLLDTCASLGGVVDEKAVTRLAGIAEKGYLFDIAGYIARRDMGAVFGALEELYAGSMDPARLCIELVRHYRNLLIAKVSGKGRLADCPAEEAELCAAQAETLAIGDIIVNMSALSEAADKMSASPDRMLTLEVCLVRMCGGGSEGYAPGNVEGRQKPRAQRDGAKKMEGKARADDAEPAGAQMRHHEKDHGKARADDAKPASESGGSKPARPPVPEGKNPQREKSAEKKEDAFSAGGPPGGRSFERWGEVVEALKGSSGMLYAFLANSKAYITYPAVQVDAGEFFQKHIRDNAGAREAMREAAARIAGVDLPVSPYSAGTPGGVEPGADGAADDIDDLISRARSAGVDLEIK